MSVDKYITQKQADTVHFKGFYLLIYLLENSRTTKCIYLTPHLFGYNMLFQVPTDIFCMCRNGRTQIWDRMRKKGSGDGTGQESGNISPYKLSGKRRK